jgi:hypothetical protein
MAIYFFIFSCERTFKIIYNTLLPFFHILLTSTNMLIERNEIVAIFNFCTTTGCIKKKVIEVQRAIVSELLYEIFSHSERSCF